MKSPVVTIWRAAAVSGAAVALSLAALPGARPAAADAAGGLLRGLDISAYQHDKTPINWGLLARQGVRFIAVKVSEGTYYRNPYYPSDARAAAAAGLQVMPYAFANPSRSGGAASAAFAVAYHRPPGRPAARAGEPAARGRPGERPLQEGHRLLRRRRHRDDLLDRRVHRAGPRADREVAGHLHDGGLVAGVHRVHQPVPA